MLPRRWPLVLMLLLGFLVCLSACGAPDPGDTTTAAFRNDLGRTVVLAMCANYGCTGGTHYADTLHAGEAVSETINANGVIQPFRIQTTSGQILGCLPIYANSTGLKLRIPLSRLTRCPGTPIRLASSSA